MSRYDLEEALREFVSGVVDRQLEDLVHSDHSEYHDDHNDYRYAPEDHSHDGSDFEEKVEHYLFDFNPGYHGCSTRQAFQNAVLAIVQHWWVNDLGELNGEGGDPVRMLLKSVLVEARKRDAASVTPILTRTIIDLRNISTTPSNGNGAANFASAADTENGLTFTRQ